MASRERINRVGYVIAPQNDNPDEVDFIRLRNPNPRYQQNRESKFTRGIRESLAFIQETLSDGLLGFITIKVILWDIFITLADITSDFIQGTMGQNLSKIGNIQNVIFQVQILLVKIINVIFQV